jgi:hypothetical protein
VQAFLTLLMSKVWVFQSGVWKCSFVFRSSWFEPQPRDRLLYTKTPFVSSVATLIFKNRTSYIKDGRTTTLQMLHFIYIFQQIYVLSILNMLHTLRFSLQSAVYFIMLLFGSCIIHILHTECAKI